MSDQRFFPSSDGDGRKGSKVTSHYSPPQVPGVKGEGFTTYPLPHGSSPAASTPTSAAAPNERGDASAPTDPGASWQVAGAEPGPEAGSPQMPGQPAYPARNPSSSGEPGSSGKQFYQRWWFWVLVVIAALVLISALGGSKDSESTLGASPSQIGKTVAVAEKELDEAGYTVTVKGIPGAQIEDPEQSWVVGQYQNGDVVELTAADWDPTEPPTPDPADPPEEEEEEEPSVEEPASEDAAQDLTVGQQNAVRSAENYLRFMSFSRQGLIEQLEFEDYSTEDATFAVDHLDVDWNEQAVKSAENYLEYMSFSRQGLIDQLIFEGFTPEQAEHGAVAAGY